MYILDVMAAHEYVSILPECPRIPIHTIRVYILEISACKMFFFFLDPGNGFRIFYDWNIFLYAYIVGHRRGIGILFPGYYINGSKNLYYEVIFSTLYFPLLNRGYIIQPLEFIF